MWSLHAKALHLRRGPQLPLPLPILEQNEAIVPRTIGYHLFSYKTRRDLTESVIDSSFKKPLVWTNYPKAEYVEYKSYPMQSYFKRAIH